MKPFNLMHGKPRQMDADKVRAHYHTMKEGDIVEHGKLRTLFSFDSENRYRSIVALARDQFFAETGIKLAPVHGVGLQYPTGWEQLEGVGRRTRTKIKGLKHEHLFALAVSDERLDENQRLIRNYMVEQIDFIAATAQTRHRALMAKVGKPEVAPQMALPA